MLGFVCVATALGQTAVAIPAFGSWDGKTYAGIAMGASEKDLAKTVIKSKTVGPDPASVRIGVEKKNWVLTALLTDTNNKGVVCGFTIDLEKDEPIESLETLQTELGPPDETDFATIRYSDWGLAVWKTKGIAAVLQNSSRPLVQKILLTSPTVLVQNLDVWPRTPNDLQAPPRLPVSGIDVSVSTSPPSREREDEIRDNLLQSTQAAMSSSGGPGWQPTSDAGARIRASFTIRSDRGVTTLNGSVSTNYRTPFGDVGLTENGVDNGDRGFRERTQAMFEQLFAKLGQDLQAKYKRFAWQTEWRQFTSLARPKS